MTRSSLFLSLILIACNTGEVGEEKDSDFGTTMPGCTEIGCADGFNGEFSPAFTTQGAYVFPLDLDGVTSSCTGSLPLNDGFSCDGDLGVSQSGSALPDDEHSLPGFYVSRYDFAQLQLTVERDGVEVASWSVSPEWSTFQPNGPECGPTCTSASANLSWP